MVGVLPWWPFGVLLTVVAVSVGLACNNGDGTERTVVITFATPTATSVPTATPTPAPTPTPTPTPLGADVCGVNPDPAPVSVLQVQEPQPLEKVGNPIHVRGWGSRIGRENIGVAVALIDASGDPLPPLEVPPQPRAGRVAPPGLKITKNTTPFAADLLVDGLSEETPFCIWVFSETTEEGVPKQVVQVPVTVSP